jgi:hypothetical protein
MNKRMGSTFSYRELFNIEAKEHGKKETPAELRRSEQKEHGLKKLPSLREAMNAEYVEHNDAMGSPVIKGSAKSRARATAMYKGTK